MITIGGKEWISSADEIYYGNRKIQEVYYGNKLIYPINNITDNNYDPDDYIVKFGGSIDIEYTVPCPNQDEYHVYRPDYTSTDITYYGDSYTYHINAKFINISKFPKTFVESWERHNGKISINNQMVSDDENYSTPMISLPLDTYEKHYFLDFTTRSADHNSRLGVLLPMNNFPSINTRIIKLNGSKFNYVSNINPLTAFYEDLLLSIDISPPIIWNSKTITSGLFSASIITREPIPNVLSMISDKLNGIYRIKHTSNFSLYNSKHNIYKYNGKTYEPCTYIDKYGENNNPEAFFNIREYPLPIISDYDFYAWHKEDTQFSPSKFPGIGGLFINNIETEKWNVVSKTDYIYSGLYDYITQNYISNNVSLWLASNLLFIPCSKIILKGFVRDFNQKELQSNFSDFNLLYE